MKINMKPINKAVKILLALLIIVIFCFLPDLLLNIRLFFASLPGFNYLVRPEVTNEVYIEIVSGAFLNCLAILISILAFKSANSAKNIQESQHKTKIIDASTKLTKIIRASLTTIYNLSQHIGNESELDITNAIDYVNCLYADKQISPDDFNYITELIKKIERIKNYYNAPNNIERDKEINEFINKYFVDKSVDKVKDLDDLLNKLSNIMK